MPRPYSDLNPSPRVLLGPGPSLVPARVLRAMATPLVGHLDPDFLVIMAEVQELLRFVFQTRNPFTLAVPGTGTAGMEAALRNLIQLGDRVLACIHGFFGERMADIAARCGAEVERLERPWGEVIDPEQIAGRLKAGSFRLATLVHAETSTGAWQPGIDVIAKACHDRGALLVLDCVTSLGGLPVEIDAWDVDVAYSASQKCLSAPPGLAPITLGPRAAQALAQRKGPVPSFYLDLSLLSRYWGEQPAYHHTAPISTIYALREALRLVDEEGLQARFDRHRANAALLWTGLEALGLPPLMPADVRLPTLTTPRLSPGCDDAGIRASLLRQYNIEIAGGFGPLAGKIWRVGLMGFSSRRENVRLLLGALQDLLGRR
jgi:alanine-glyoxylate transaminase/serine-glyoxylate transaminase/serine-pyruvate transaminase